nr:FUSC family protein [Clostridiales bacterium]
YIIKGIIKINSRLKKHIIGMRNIKTAFAVLLCMLIFSFLQILSSALPESQIKIVSFIKFLLDRGNPIFACVACVVVMQNSIKNSKLFAISRIFGTAIGTLNGLIFSIVTQKITLGYLNYFIIFIGIIIIIKICNSIKHPDASSISIITFLVIMISLDYGSPVLYAINRFIDTVIGITISLAVNRNINAPPD